MTLSTSPVVTNRNIFFLSLGVVGSITGICLIARGCLGVAQVPLPFKMTFTGSLIVIGVASGATLLFASIAGTQVLLIIKRSLHKKKNLKNNNHVYTH